MAGVLDDLASAPLPAVGPRKTFVLDVRPDMLEIRVSTVEDTVFCTTPLRKLAWDSIRRSLVDGRRTALILLCALAGPLATSEARLRDVAPERLAFGRRVQSALATILESCSTAASQNPKWQVESHVAAVGSARKCVLACDMGGALLSTVSALVDRSASWNMRETPVACIDGPLSASRALPRAWAVLPHRPQPRLPRFDRAASTAVSAIVAVFPDELVAHVSTDSDMSTSSDLSDTPDTRTPQLTDEQRTMLAKGFAWRVGEWARSSGVQVVFTAQELVEEVVLHAFPNLRIVDGVDRRQLYQLTRRLAGGGASRDRVRAAVECFSMTGVPAGWCEASASAVLQAVLHSETSGLVSVTPEATPTESDGDGVESAGAVLISSPAHAVAKRGLECFRKASQCLDNPATLRVVHAAGWEVLLCFAAGVARDEAIDADVRNWLAAAMRSCATTLIASTYSVSTRVAAGIAAGAKAPNPFPDEPEPFESIDHMLRIVSCSVEIACALLRVEP